MNCVDEISLLNILNPTFKDKRRVKTIVHKMLWIYVFTIFSFFNSIEGFLCGDNGRCVCYPHQRKIYCRTVTSPLDIDFHSDIAMDYDILYVPDSFKCEELVKLGLRTGLSVKNNLPCYTPSGEIVDHGDTSDTKTFDTKRGGETIHDALHPIHHTIVPSQRDTIHQSNVNNVDTSYTTFDMTYKVINMIIFIIMTIAGIKIHYNMRPFLRLLPRPYVNFRGFISFLLRKKTEVPDVSTHFDVSFHTNRDDTDNNDPASGNAGGTVYVHAHSEGTDAQNNSSNEQLDVEKGACGGQVTEPDVSSKSPIEKISPSLIDSSNSQHPPGVHGKTDIMNESRITPPVASSTKLYETSVSKKVPPPFPPRIPHKMKLELERRTSVIKNISPIKECTPREEISETLYETSIVSETDGSYHSTPRTS